MGFFASLLSGEAETSTSESSSHGTHGTHDDSSGYEQSLYSGNEETHTSHESHESGHDEINDFGIGTLALAMGFGIVSRVYLTHVTGLPYTVVLLIIGLIFGFVLHGEIPGQLGLLSVSLEKWINVSPHVILFVFLPILIFESAFNTDVHIFQRQFWQILMLAGPGVILATALTACVVKYVFPYGWEWSAALMLGGILSATDPVAVVALLKELGVSERLAILIEGESLLNDAAAIVIFIVFRNAFVGYQEMSVVGVLETASRMSLGGPVVGVVLGMLGSFALGYVFDDELTEITLTVIVCFSAFMVSEATELEVSGVLAVVTTGLVMSFYARGRISPGVEKTMHDFWSVATYVANTVIFFVSGLIIGDRIFFDEHIEARDWGLMALLYVALQIIRVVVILSILPVLTRGGYGMSYKQIAVLAFGGLRGAVGLTLGLIVEEDERIEERTRSLVLFYVSGIAALTLLINGSLAGSLVHYLGLDSSSHAETEVFTRACSAIEARLEHKLDLLKGDRFLGDADWEIVWRYIPVSTAKTYWHRIRHGNINLSEREEEDINDIIHRHGSSGGSFAHRVQKWLTRRVLRLSGGTHYDDLPRRLRQTWYSYHKNYHFSHHPAAGTAAFLAMSAASTALEEARHQRDLELHHLNAEPRMIVEAEAWANLEEDGGAVKVKSAKATVSSTLRNHLDNVGVTGLKNSTGMMSDLGQARMEQQAVGPKPGSLLGAPGGGAVTVPKQALRAVEGIKKLTEDRRRAAQAVAKAEARMERLKKDMGLIRHRGEEQEMAQSIQQARGRKGLRRASASYSALDTLNHTAPSGTAHGTSSGALDKLDQKNSAGAAQKTAFSSARMGHLFGAVSTSSYTGFDNNPLSNDTGGKKKKKTKGPEEEDEKSGFGDPYEVGGPASPGSSDVGLPMDDTTLGGLKTRGRGLGAEGAGGGYGLTPALLDDGYGPPAAAKGDPAMKPEGAMKPGWSPFSDSEEEYDEEAGLHLAGGGDSPADRPHRGGRATDGNRRRGLNMRTGGVIGPGTVTMGSMSEARVRFLTAVKAHFTERYRQGWLSSTGLRVLKGNMDAQLDEEEKELDQWGRLSSAFTLPRRLIVMRKIPLVGSLVESYMYRGLTFIFELASNFIAAHEDVDILELLNEGPVAYQLALEKNRQLKEARTTLAQQLPVFPELARSLKTRVAARYMLVQHRDVAHELSRLGHITEREFEGLIEQNNMARVRLDYHPQADQIPDRVTLLKNVPFLRFLTDKEKEAVIKDEKACQEEFYGSSVVLMQEKTSFGKGKRRAGWFNVVRGAVRKTTEGLVDHTSAGGTMHRRRLAKERLVSAGTVIGLDDQLLEAPYRCTYVTASFVHLFFFDKTQMLNLAEQYPGLKRGLWWLLGVSVVRHHHGFRRMNLTGVYQLMRTAEFKELKTPKASNNNRELMDSRHGRRSLSRMSPPGSLNASRHRSGRSGANSPRRRTIEPPAFVRGAAGLNESRHRNSTSAVRHRVFLEEGSSVLLLRGVMLKREETTLFGGLGEQRAVAIIRDVSGPLDFSDGSVMFVMPAILLARASSSHQLLMQEIEERYNLMTETASATQQSDSMSTESPTLVGLSTNSGRWRESSLSASGKPGHPASPRSPSRLTLSPPAGARNSARGPEELVPAGGTYARNAVAMDSATIAAVDEANPIAHPDTVRRQRTLRDAGLAAKATLSTSQSLSGGGGRDGGKSGGVDGGEGDDNGSVESGTSSRHASGWSTSGLLPIRAMSRTGMVAIAPGNEGEEEFEERDGGKRRRWLLGSGFSTTRVALTSAKHGDSFVEMMDMPVANMEEEPSRLS